MDKNLIEKASNYFENNTTIFLAFDEYLFRKEARDLDLTDSYFDNVKIEWKTSGRIKRLPNYISSVNHREPTIEIIRKVKIEFTITNYKNEYVIPINKIVLFKCMTNEAFEFTNIRLNDQSAEIEEVYSDQIFRIYEREKLRCLSVSTTEFSGQNPSIYFSKKVGNLKPTREVEFNFNYEQELRNCNKDIKYFLGQLIYYSDLMPITIFKPAEHNDNVFTFFQSRPIVRYVQIANCLFEKTYNYWDAIGDTLDYYLKTGLKKRQVNFSTVIDSLLKQYPLIVKKSEDFEWLVNFKENNYKNINSKRKDIVHYFNLETQLWTNWLKSNTDKKKILEIQNEIFSYSDLFKIELENSLSGYQKSLNFIHEFQNEINNGT